MPITDAEIVSAALAGSADAYRQLVERFQRPIFSLIVRMVRDPALAEDLAQDVFIKAFRNLARFDLERKLSSWLFKIAHNTALDHLRKKRLATVPLEASSSDSEDTWEVVPAPADEGPDRRLEQRRLAAAIEAALGRLRARYREVLLLRFEHGLAYHEIAEVTGQAMGTVKIQLHRARKQLAAELERAGLEMPARFAPGRAKQRTAGSRRGSRGG